MYAALVNWCNIYSNAIVVRCKLLELYLCKNTAVNSIQDERVDELSVEEHGGEKVRRGCGRFGASAPDPMPAGRQVGGARIALH